MKNTRDEQPELQSAKATDINVGSPLHWYGERTGGARTIM